MSGGPFSPFSMTPDTSADVFPNVHVGSTNARLFAGMGVISGGPAADQLVALQFMMPPTIPVGQVKLLTLLIANATSGDAIFRPEWISAADDVDIDAATLGVEANTTVTWAAGDVDHIFVRKIDLDAVTAPAANEVVHMNLVFEATGYTVAAVVTYNFFIIWE